MCTVSDRGRGEHRLQWSCGGSDRSGCASSITIACCRAQTQRFHNNGFKGSVYTSHTTPPYSLNTWHRFAFRYKTTVGYEFFTDETKVHTHSTSGSLARTAAAQTCATPRGDIRVAAALIDWLHS